MDYLEQLLGIDLDVTTRTLIAFVVVLVLIVFIALIFRRLSRGPARGGRRGRLARLAILEAVSIDQKRRLMLMRRDNVEHLVLIGGNTDLVIEQGIQRAARQPGARGVDRVEPSVRQATAARPAESSPGRNAHPPAPTPTPRGNVPADAAQPAGPEGDAEERQLADMADRLKAALREPLPDGAHGGRTPAPDADHGPAKNKFPTPGNPRKPD